MNFIAAFAKPWRPLRYKKKFFLNAVSQGTRRTAMNAIKGEKRKDKINSVKKQ